MKISTLIGKILTDIKINSGKTEIIFTDSDEIQHKMYHSQDCCEHVSIDDIVGDLSNLLNTPIIKAEESSNTDNPKKTVYDEGEADGYVYVDESCTWTFYKLATIKGYVDIKWYGSSNGYYSERVDFVQLGTEDEYGYYPDED